MAGSKVQLQAMANVSAIAPGKPFLLGFKFSIQPGWHIYWKNPGDSGLPTEVKLNLPTGFTADPIQFPVPKRLQLPGDIVNYAYEDQMMLMVHITPAKDLAVGSTIKLDGRASWLVCQDVCIPGKTEWSIQLPVAGTALPANEPVFKQWTDRLPVETDSADIAAEWHGVTVNNGNGPAKIRVHWKKTPNEIQFFPGMLKDANVSNIKINTVGDDTKISFDLTNYTDQEPVTGLLVFTPVGGEKTGVEISIPYGAGGPAAEDF